MLSKRLVLAAADWAVGWHCCWRSWQRWASFEVSIPWTLRGLSCLRASSSHYTAADAALLLLFCLCWLSIHYSYICCVYCQFCSTVHHRMMRPWRDIFYPHSHRPWGYSRTWSFPNNDDQHWLTNPYLLCWGIFPVFPDHLLVFSWLSAVLSQQSLDHSRTQGAFTGFNCYKVLPLGYIIRSAPQQQGVYAIYHNIPSAEVGPPQVQA